MKYGKIIDGSLIIGKGCKDDFSEVEEIKGYKISELIKLTKGQYGNETFKNFFKDKDNE